MYESNLYESNSYKNWFQAWLLGIATTSWRTYFLNSQEDGEYWRLLNFWGQSYESYDHWPVVLSKMCTAGYPNMPYTNPSSTRLLCDPVTEDPNYQPAPEDRPGGFQWGQVCKKMLNLGRSQVLYLALYLASSKHVIRTWFLTQAGDVNAEGEEDEEDWTSLDWTLVAKLYMF